MMANKIFLKKYLLGSLFVIFILTGVGLVLNWGEYRAYNEAYNRKVSAMVVLLEEKYPEITENEIMEILNEEGEETELFQKYGIDIKKESVVLENDATFKWAAVMNAALLVLFGGMLIALFYFYNHRKDKEIAEITKCIEQINRKNYALSIDDISEDELSILKSEIYKTTLMLKEQAENSNREKLELKDSLSDISHQLKTPLTSILIMLDNIIEDPDMPQEIRADFIMDIKREISNISFLVQSLLKLSKLDTNTVDFRKESVEAEKLVEEAVRNVASLCDLRDVSVTVETKGDARIFCDFRWQVEALTNIIKNCVEHSPSGEKVKVSVSENSVYTGIFVEDHGVGIVPEDLPHIFERFYKGKNATKDSVGIGLALAKTIVEKDNGSISVDSDETGTKFSIKFFHG